MRRRRVVAANLALLMVLSACTSGVTSEDSPGGTSEPLSGVAQPGADPAPTTTGGSGDDTSGITDVEENTATINIVAEDETITEDLKGSVPVTCSTSGDERDGASVFVYLTGDNTEMSVSTEGSGAVPGTYVADLKVSVSGWEIGVMRTGEVTLVLDRTVEIAGDYAGDLWLFEGSFTGSLTDEGPGVDVQGTFACIGHVSWAFNG